MVEEQHQLFQTQISHFQRIAALLRQMVRNILDAMLQRCRRAFSERIQHMVERNSINFFNLVRMVSERTLVYHLLVYEHHLLTFICLIEF